MWQTHKGGFTGSHREGNPAIRDEGMKDMKNTMLSKTSQSQNTDSITPHTKDSSTVTLREAESRA